MKPLYFSSKKIATLANKPHSDVINDISKIIEEIPEPDNYLKMVNAAGNTIKYLLSKELILTVVSGYDTKSRYNVIKQLNKVERNLLISKIENYCPYNETTKTIISFILENV